MPIELDNTNIIINNNSTTSNILEVIKSKGSYTEKAAESSVYSCGSSYYGQLGHGNNSEKNIPTLIQYFVTNNITISHVSGGSAHSIFLATNGNVYSCGWNGYGLLGHGNNSDQNTPTLIDYFANNNITISHVSGGRFHSIFLATNGNVYSCGSCNSGQLGHGNFSDQNTPTLIQYFVTNNITISHVSGGEQHSIFLATNGNVYSCGKGYGGQLGHVSDSDQNIPTLIQEFVDKDITISNVSGGYIHSIFLATNGNVYSCGIGENGRLGHGDSSYQNTPTLIQYFVTNNITISHVSGGIAHSIFLATNGNVYSCGYGGSGQLGHGNYSDQNIPTLIDYFATNNITISHVSCSGNHSIFLAINGNVYSCGHGHYRQLGHGNNSDQTIPTLIQDFVDKDITISHISGCGQHSIFVSNDPYYQTIEYPAQWTYSSTDASVYHLGNVGIGTEADTSKSLTITGDINVDGNIFINDVKMNLPKYKYSLYDNEPTISNNIRSLPVYDNKTDSIQKAAEDVSGVKGWRLVRFLPGNATTWHPINDSLVGTTTYGTAYDYSNAFSVEFGDFDEFMFSNANMRNWLHATREQVIGGTYDNAQRTIIKSSISNNSYEARWYNRSTGHDPLITVEDWSVSSVGDRHGILYMEDSYNSLKEYFSNSGGMCVFVRNSTYSVSSVATDYTHKYMMFTYDSTRDVSGQTEYTINFPLDITCDILIVGGGGAGGYNAGAGGGSGGLVYGSGITMNGTYNIKVGKGGVFSSNGTNIDNGNDSEITNGTQTIIAKGGGSGSDSDNVGQNGGSGGGGSGYSSDRQGGTSTQQAGFTFEGKTLIGYGNLGGLGRYEERGGWTRAGGGGGGAGASGNTSGDYASDTGQVARIDYGGDGGIGLQYNITGVNTYYAGGGGGGIHNNQNNGYPGSGGSGGGGNAGQPYNAGTSGLANTGGGGGSGGGGNASGGAGGSGVVIIRYVLGNVRNYLSNWTYSSSYDEVSIMGYVGIGKTPTTELDIDGSIVATTKSFKIEHPIVNNMHLYHACIEGPRFDNIYRGKKVLVNGYCEVDIDTECNNTGGMIPGTFVALNTDCQLYLQNNQTFDKVKGYIEDGKIKINSLNTTDNILVDWLVIGERQDRGVIKNSLTNAKGKLICEH